MREVTDAAAVAATRGDGTPDGTERAVIVILSVVCLGAVPRCDLSGRSKLPPVVWDTLPSLSRMPEMG